MVFHINISSIILEASSSGLSDCCGPGFPGQRTGQASNLAHPSGSFTLLMWPARLYVVYLFVRFLAEILLQVKIKKGHILFCLSWTWISFHEAGIMLDSSLHVIKVHVSPCKVGIFKSIKLFCFSFPLLLISSTVYADLCQWYPLFMCANDSHDTTKRHL